MSNDGYTIVCTLVYTYTYVDVQQVFALDKGGMTSFSFQEDIYLICTIEPKMDPDIQVELWNWISVVIFTWKETPDEAVRFSSCLGFKVLEHLIPLCKNSCLF